MKNYLFKKLMPGQKAPCHLKNMIPQMGVTLFMISALPTYSLTDDLENGYVVKDVLSHYETIFQQQPPIKVSGKIQDKTTGELLIGVTVMVKKDSTETTVTGTTTDVEGKFTLDVPDENTILVISYMGYEKLEISAANFINDKNFKAQLAPSAAQLEQVVVIGYGEQAKDKVTGAITQVKGEELNKYAGSSFAQQLSGKAAGVLINEASAMPGTNPQVVIRGIGTLTAGRNPLIVVDGFPLSEGSSLNSINPLDIASLEVLKDPASAAIYGSRAANGVILLTTKKGSGNKLRVSFDAYTGIQERADKMELADAYQSAQFFTEARDNGYVSKNPSVRSANDDEATRIANGASLRERRLGYLQPYLENQPGLTNTNWLDEIFRRASINNYNLSLSGGSQKSNFYVGLNSFNQRGIVIGTGLERYSATIRIESELSKRFSFGINAYPSYNKQDYFENTGDRSVDPIGIALIMYPNFSAYNPDGSLAISQQIIANTPQDGALAENPVAIMEKTKYNRNDFRVFGSTYLKMKIIEGLTYKLNVGGDFRNSFYDYYSPSDVGAYRTNAANKLALAQETNANIGNYLIENTLNYKKNFRDHQLDVLAGYTFQKESGASSIITGSSIPDNNIQNIAGASAFRATASRYTWTQISYLARVQYAYKNRYLLSVATRRDGSSRFGVNNQWGDFPSVTAGWIASREGFFPQNKVVTFAKLRASWGISGNNQIGNYKSQSLISADNYVFGNTLGAGFASTSGANSNLSWETKTSVDLGIDIGLFKKVNLTADYYTSVTDDLLLDVPVPEQSGYSTLIQNIGKVRNTGVELELSIVDINLGKVKWAFGANAAYNTNKVLALGNGQDQILQAAGNGVSAFRTKVGGPVAEMYGYNVIGVYKNQDQISSSAHMTGTLVGDQIIQDVNSDGKIDEKDKIGFGTYMPKYTYGFSNNFGYKNFELSFAFAGIWGRKIYDNALVGAEGGEGFATPNTYYYENRYDPVSNPNGTLAMPNLGNFSAPRKAVYASNLYYYKADYFRLRNIQLSYNFPDKVLSRLKVTNVRVYISANNLFTITSYRGFNPESTSDNALTAGYSSGNYPVAKSYMAGVNFTF